MHKMIKQVTEQIPSLQYNTAIAAMMEYLNVLRAEGRTAHKSEIEPLLVLLAPFAPHITEELYARFGHKEGIFDSASWPSYDEAKFAEDMVEIAVQVNGRLRGRVKVPVEADEETVVEAARASTNVARHLDDKNVRKVILVPHKLVNLVV